MAYVDENSYVYVIIYQFNKLSTDCSGEVSTLSDLDTLAFQMKIKNITESIQLPSLVDRRQLVLVDVQSRNIE